MVLAAALLAGCAKTPENVKGEDSSNDSQVQGDSQAETANSSQSEAVREKAAFTKTVGEADFEKCVQGSREKILAGGYDNLKIDSDFKVVASAYPSVYQAVVSSDYDKNADDIFGLFLPDKTQGYYPSKKQLHTNEDTGVRSYEYTNGTSTGFVSSDGMVAIVENEYMNKAEYGNTTPVNETRNLIMPVTDDKLSLGESSIDLRDVQRKSAERLSYLIAYAKESSKIECQFGYQPYSVSTVTEQSGEVLAFAHCRTTVDNTPVFDTIPIGDSFLDMPLLQGSFLTFNAKGDIVQMNTGSGLEVKSGEKPKEILTAEYAFETASKALAPHIDHTARFEELVLVPTVSKADKENPHMKLNSGESVTLKPYWVIHFETDWWKEIYAAVDAVTGEVEYVNNRQ